MMPLEWVTLRLNIMLKSYLSAIIYTQYTIAEWFCYNLAAKSFNAKKLCSRFYSIKLKFYSQKRQICFLIHPSEELGVMYGTHCIYS